MPNRRQALIHATRVAALLAGAGWLPATAHAAYNQALFDSKSLADLAKALGGSAPQASKDVSIGGPDVAEDGANVPLVVGSSLPGVRKLLVFIEKNPSPLSAQLELTDGVETSVSLRVKMNQSSNVYAVALAADGKVFFAQREVRVTVGACGA